jgi:predicted anti-sigma-YlaC factor YlaD
MSEYRQCRDLLGDLVDFLDGEAEKALCAAIEQHMRECDNCRVLVDTLRKTIDLYQIHPSAPDDMPPEVRMRLYRRLNLEAFLNPPTS